MIRLVQPGTNKVLVVADEGAAEHWKSLGYTQEKKAPARKPAAKSDAGDKPAS